MSEADRIESSVVKTLTAGAKNCRKSTVRMVISGTRLSESGARRGDHSDAMIKGVGDVDVALFIDRYPEGIVEAAI